MKQIYICDIRSGEKLTDTFLVADKNLAFSQKGSAYLNLRLKDKTGQIEAKVWEKAVEWDRLFRRGDVIRVTARALQYRNTLQLSLLDIASVASEEIDRDDYLPVTAASIEDMFQALLEITDQIETPVLKKLVTLFLLDETIAELFKRAPAAKGFHHDYIGGLLEHTLSVTRLLREVADHYPGIQRDLLLTGGILHDIGKIHEFNYERFIEYSDSGRLIGHIVMGVEMIDGKIKEIDHFPDYLAIELRHVLLSHHGLLEYGSPKRPKTLEAQIVHSLDDLDAKVNAFQSFIAQSPDDDSHWTPFHRLFERYLYRRKEE